MYFIEIAGVYINPSQVTMIEKGIEEGETLIYLADRHVVHAPTGDAEDVADRIACAEEGKKPEEVG